MLLDLQRCEFTEKSTISKISIDGTFFCFGLEDVCREDKPGTWAKTLKVPNETAIPYGIYRVVQSMSARFKKLLPEVLGVPDYAGIRIHAGNKPADTEGCILVGLVRNTDWVGNSVAAMGALQRHLEDAARRGEKIWLSITKENK
jgi:hypothetical protein